MSDKVKIRKEGVKVSSQWERFSRDDIAHVISSMEPDMSLAKSKRMVQLIFDTISIAIQSGKQVTIPKFCTFSAAYQAERRGIHPLTYEEILVPPTIRLKCKASMSLKQALQQQKEIFAEKHNALYEYVQIDDQANESQ
jgi:nucleoid DNA-binding protein